MRHILFFMLVAISFSTARSQSITGTWDRQGSVQGYTWRMILSPGGSYEMLANSVSRIVGSYWTSQDTLIYHDVGGQWSCDTTIIGMSQFVVTATQLTITLIVDSCSNRNEVLNATWDRLSLEVSEIDPLFAGEYLLAQNYPNPFNPSTTISYQLPTQSHVTLKVYDLLGREVATLVNETKPLGSYQVTWDASGVSSGVFFYRLQAGDFIQTRKLVLMK